MEKVEKIIKLMNKDFENRKSGLKTYPFRKQGMLAQAYSALVNEHVEYFCLSEEYYPNESMIDVENLPHVRFEVEEIKKQGSYKKDLSVNRTI